MHVIRSNHLQLIAWKSALFCYSTDSVQFTENTSVNTYLHLVGEMGMNTQAHSQQPFTATYANFASKASFIVHTFHYQSM